MPGPLNGLDRGLISAARLGLSLAKQQGYVKADYRGREYISRHGKCVNGVNCTGPGCRVNRGK